MFAQLHARGRAAPSWLRGVVALACFGVPLVWVLGEDNLFDVFLRLVTRLAGPTADLRHLLAYLLCTLVLLVPGGLLIQLVGGVRRSAASQER